MFPLTWSIYPKCGHLMRWSKSARRTKYFGILTGGRVVGKSSLPALGLPHATAGRAVKIWPEIHLIPLKIIKLVSLRHHKFWPIRSLNLRISYAKADSYWLRRHRAVKFFRLLFLSNIYWKFQDGMMRFILKRVTFIRFSGRYVPSANGLYLW